MHRPTLFVDASVVVKWILPEEGRAEALRIQEKYEDEDIDLVAPYFVIASTKGRMPIAMRQSRRQA